VAPRAGREAGFPYPGVMCPPACAPLPRNSLRPKVSTVISEAALPGQPEALRVESVRRALGHVVPTELEPRCPNSAGTRRSRRRVSSQTVDAADVLAHHVHLDPVESASRGLGELPEIVRADVEASAYRRTREILASSMRPSTRYDARKRTA